jgi:hypothetical protein
MNFVSKWSALVHVLCDITLLINLNFVVAFQFLTNEKRNRQLLKHCVITVQYGEDGKKNPG